MIIKFGKLDLQKRKFGQANLGKALQAFLVKEAADSQIFMDSEIGC